eukprot:GHVO01063089.1.p1 GENE.GHVO01063089.1~~GHVO01063089.1.p1  ORF type:complete len:295 (+),score=42.46 GHVO01063089.1:71-955(+)
MTLDVKSTDCVLLIWGNDSNPEQLKDAVNQIKDKCSKVQLENADRLLMAGHTQSTFDVVACGHLGAANVVLNADCLAEVAKVLKPGGSLMLREAVVKDEGAKELRTSAKLISALKLAGFVDISEPVTYNVPDKCDYKKILSVSEFDVVDICALKPNYEVGAASQLKLSFAATDKTEVAKVWSLENDLGDDDLDLIDEDDLLDDDDLLKPDPSSLRATCSDGPKKRKACKNCSCGLAEELDAEVAKTAPPKATSSCGSCYLGDAFRCASCPYLGMPAFKPGEKIVLSDRQLNADD